MDTKKTNRLIAAGGMALVIGIGAAAFLRSSPIAPVAREDAPAAPAAEAPVDPTVGDQPPAAPTPSAETPTDSPAATANDTLNHKESKPSVPDAAKPRTGRQRDSANVDAGTRGSGPTEPMAAATHKPALADRPDASLASAAAPMTASAAAVDAETGANGKSAASDTEITSEVKSAIASEGLVKDSSVAVSTTDGVVALSGSVPSQAAIDQLKDVAAKVKDVKGVDTSGLIASL